MKCRPRSLPSETSLSQVSLLLQSGHGEAQSESFFFFWWGGGVSYESSSFPTSSQDASLFPHAGLYSGYCSHVASGRGCITPAQALAAPAEPARSSIQGSVAGPGTLGGLCGCPSSSKVPVPPRGWLCSPSLSAEIALLTGSGSPPSPSWHLWGVL